MNVHSIAILFLLTTACCLSAQPGLPANPDPDKCYTRLIAPAEYEMYYEYHLTYSQEEASLFPCETIEVEVKSARSIWEYVIAPDDVVCVDGLIMGDQQSSLTITKQRAQRISNYLVSQGVSGERIIPLGYGESKPKYYCGRGARCTETIHAENEMIVFWVPNI